MSELTDIERRFIRWENDVFGFGYGSGEEPVLIALRLFLQHAFERGNYDYAELQEQIGASTTWLLINTLCHADVIEYGTSPRFGWIDHDPETQELMRFIADTSVDRLLELVSIGFEYYQ